MRIGSFKCCLGGVLLAMVSFIASAGRSRVPCASKWKASMVVTGTIDVTADGGELQFLLTGQTGGPTRKRAPRSLRKSAPLGA